MKKILIIGSNFGSKIYLTAFLKLDQLFQIYICSPNIYNKKINKKIVKYKSYEKAILENNFEYIICVATPNVQFKVLEFLNKNKIGLNGILLEKPISENLPKIQKSIKILNVNKIPFFVNFIFTELETYKKLKKILKKNDINEINYTWTFKQSYFINKIPTWKINDNLGGGLLKYYGIHAIYNLVDLININKNIGFKIEDIVFKKKHISALKVKILHKNISINLLLNINSKKNLHRINLIGKNNNIELVNKQKDWTKGFELIKNKKIFKLKKESRISLVKKIIKKKIIKDELKKKKYNFKYLSKVSIAHLICEKIHKKSKILIS